MIQSISLTFTSRLIGFLRLIVETTLLGLTGITDAYQAAFRLTNFFREVFGEGAIGSVFTPMYANSVEKEGKQRSQNFFWTATALSCLGSIFLFLFLILNLEWLLNVWMPELPQASKKWVLILAPIMLPYLICMATASMFMVMHQIKGRFIYSSLHPILFSISVILFGLWNPTDNHAKSLAWGVISGGLLQLGLLSLTLNYPLPKITFFREQLPKIKNLLLLLTPIILSLIVHRTNRLIDLYFAAGLASGSLSSLSYSFVLINVPLGLISVASNAVFYPVISRLKAEEKITQYQNAVISNLNFISLLGFWSMGLLVFHSHSLVNYLFIDTPNWIGFSTQFDQRAAGLMGDALQYYSIGLGFLILNPYLIKLFHSHLDTRFPAKLAVLMVLINVLLNYYLTLILFHRVIALATSLVAICFCLLLVCGLQIKSYINISVKDIFQWISKLVLSMIIFGVCIQFTLPFGLFGQIIIPSMIYFGFWHLVELRTANVVDPLT